MDLNNQTQLLLVCQEIVSAWRSREPSLQGYVTKGALKWRIWSGRLLWSRNKAVARTKKAPGTISTCSGPSDQAAASGPVSITKANTRFPLQTWPSSSYLITKWMHLLQREKASCRLCLQLFLGLPLLGPISHLFLLCLFHSWIHTQTHVLCRPVHRTSCS